MEQVALATALLAATGFMAVLYWSVKDTRDYAPVIATIGMWLTGLLFGLVVATV